MKNLLAIIMSVLLLTAGIATANAAELKVGVIDLQKIIKESPKVKAINKKLQKQFKTRQDKIVKLQKDVQAKIAKFQRDETVMSKKDKEAKQKDIVELRRKLQRQEEDYRRDLSSAQSEEMKVFLADVKKAVEKIRKRDNYDLILQKAAVVDVSARLQITDEVLKQL